MKKIVYTVLMLLCCNLYAQTNQYIPFPDEAFSTIWRVEQNGSITTRTTLDKSMVGDTLINTLVYKKYHEDSKLRGAIRNDIPNRRVYSYDFSLKKDTVMYDFDLNVGDTVLITPPFKYWVEDIDSVLLLDNVYHNRYKFNQPPPNGMTPAPTLSPLVEGLGFYAGNKFQNISYGNEHGILYTTVCASADKKLLVAMFGIPPLKEYCGAILVNVPDLQQEKRIMLFPNPTNARLELRT